MHMPPRAGVEEASVRAGPAEEPGVSEHRVPDVRLVGGVVLLEPEHPDPHREPIPDPGLRASTDAARGGGRQHTRLPTYTTVGGVGGIGVSTSACLQILNPNPTQVAARVLLACGRIRTNRAQNGRRSVFLTGRVDLRFPMKVRNGGLSVRAASA